MRRWRTLVVVVVVMSVAGLGALVLYDQAEQRARVGEDLEDKARRLRALMLGDTAGHEAALIADLELIAKEPIFAPPERRSNDAGPLLAARLAIRPGSPPEVVQAYLQRWGRTSTATVDGATLVEALGPFDHWDAERSSAIALPEQPDPTTAVLNEPILDPQSLGDLLLDHVAASDEAHRAQACREATHGLELMLHSGDSLHALVAVRKLGELPCPGLPAEDLLRRAWRAYWALPVAFLPQTPARRRAALIAAAGPERSCDALRSTASVLVAEWSLFRRAEPKFAAELEGHMRRCEARGLLAAVEVWRDTPFFVDLYRLRALKQGFVDRGRLSAEEADRISLLTESGRRLLLAFFVAEIPVNHFRYYAADLER